MEHSVDPMALAQAQSLRQQAAQFLVMAHRLDGMLPCVVAHEHRQGTDVGLVWATADLDKLQAADLMGTTLEVAHGEHMTIVAVSSPSSFVAAESGSHDWNPPAVEPGQRTVVSLDGGLTFFPVDQGVRVHFERIDVPGEDERGELQINLSNEGIVVDVWVSRDETLDHNIGTSSKAIDELVADLVEDGA
jgi:hypothetical protein